MLPFFLLLLVVIKLFLLLINYYLNYESLVWADAACQVGIVRKLFVDCQGKHNKYNLRAKDGYLKK